MIILFMKVPIYEVMNLKKPLLPRNSGFLQRPIPT